MDSGTDCTVQREQGDQTNPRVHVLSETLTHFLRKKLTKCIQRKCSEVRGRNELKRSLHQ